MIVEHITFPGNLPPVLRNTEHPGPWLATEALTGQLQPIVTGAVPSLLIKYPGTEWTAHVKALPGRTGVLFDLSRGGYQVVFNVACFRSEEAEAMNKYVKALATKLGVDDPRRAEHSLFLYSGVLDVFTTAPVLEKAGQIAFHLWYCLMMGYFMNGGQITKGGQP